MTGGVRLFAAACVLAAALFCPIAAGAQAAGPGTAQEPQPETGLRPSVRVFAYPDEPRPGEPFVCVVAGEADAFKAALVDSGGKTAAASFFFPLTLAEAGEPVRIALFAVPNTAPKGAAAVRALGTDGTLIAVADLLIQNRDFLNEEIPLDSKNTEIRTKQDAQKTAEALELWTILGSFSSAALWTEERFALPLESTRRTSGFGDRRLYRYSNGETEKSIHAGVDFGVPAGTSVRSAAAGKVVFARDRIVTGKTVIVEHLPGVFSLYYHLSRIDAAEGSFVEGGSLIGSTGSTGLSTGPHLHWEVRIAGEAADPDALAARPLLDKEAVLSRIKGSRVPE